MPSTFLRLLSVAALVAGGALANPMATGNNPTPALQPRGGNTGLPLNPVDAVLHPLEMLLTNGQKLARGLPLNKPHHRRQADRTGRPRARPSSTPKTVNTQSSGECAPRKGVIHVTAPQRDGDRPALNGYLSNRGNDYGELEYTTERRDALAVTIDNCTGTPFDILASNGFKAYPYVGATSGFSNDNADLRSGSYNYAYIGGVSQTAPRAPPQTAGNSFTAATDVAEPSESAIWSFRDSGNNLQAQWVNTDGSFPSDTLVYVPSENVFVLVGDVGSFEQAFENVSEATFTFES